ncbi:MAG: hypothetical protein ACRCU5_08835 [Rhizobiaceae bacterium]
MQRSKIAALILCGFVGAMFPSVAQAHDVTKACDDERVLKSIAKRFHKQSRIVNDVDLRISELSNMHEHRSIEKSEFSPIARRYCGATATLSDGRQREVWYLIESSAGLAGWGNGVEFCVLGFDRWNVYNSGCRVLR